MKTKNPIHVVGHGIDTDVFRPVKVVGQKMPWQEMSDQGSVFRVLSVGRISPVKGYDVFIEAIRLVLKQYDRMSVRMVGGPGLRAHEEYHSRLQRMAQERGLEDVIMFVGPKSHAEILNEYQGADVFVNLSGTGSLDKAVLEAMACGVPVITSNEAFQGLLQHVDGGLFAREEPHAVATAIERIIQMPRETRRTLGGKLRAIVVRDHDLKQLVAKILAIIMKEAL